MKICWDNLEGVWLNDQGEFIKGDHTHFVYKEKCKYCGEEYLTGKYKPSEYCNVSCAQVKDIKGQKFNRLSVKKHVGYSKNNGAKWRCLCDCGNICVVTGCALRDGTIKSCGCLNKELATALGKSKKGTRVSKDTLRKMSIANLGKKLLPEVKEKIGRASTGRKHTKESREKMSGLTHYNYNLNLTDEDRINRRQIPGYKEWVQAVLKRDNYTCQICGDNTGGNLIAHHLESYRDNPKLRTTLSNGTTVCEKHHLDFHHQYGYGHNTRKQFEEFKEESDYNDPI